MFFNFLKAFHHQKSYNVVDMLSFSVFFHPATIDFDTNGTVVWYVITLPLFLSILDNIIIHLASLARPLDCCILISNQGTSTPPKVQSFTSNVHHFMKHMTVKNDFVTPHKTCFSLDTACTWLHSVCIRISHSVNIMRLFVQIHWNSCDPSVCFTAL